MRGGPRKWAWTGSIPDPGGTDLLASLFSTRRVVPRIRLRGLAITSTRRLAAAPDLPTVSELGYPEASIQVWHDLPAPVNTPSEIIQHGKVVKRARR